jgi:hypothetical protein
MNDKYFSGGLITYLLIAILTFGYSYNAGYESPRNTFVTAEETNGARAMMSAMLWPLYWSLQAFKSIRPEVKP